MSQKSQIILLVLLCYLISRSSSYVSEGAYFTKSSFHVVEGNSIQITAVYNDFHCGLKCERLPECLSLNIADQPNKDGLYECVLLRNDTSESTRLLRPSHVYHHYTRLVDKCATPRCMNGGTCETLVNDFRCHCLQGFMGKQCENKYNCWLKINTSPVCFGAKDSSYGRFYVKVNGTVTTVKLVNLSGFVSCDDKQISWRGNWGCKDTLLCTIITDENNRLILPQDKDITWTNSPWLEYSMPVFHARSPELVFNFTKPTRVTAGQEYRIWYGQDLKDLYETNNEGTACVDVLMYGWFS